MSSQKKNLKKEKKTSKFFFFFFFQGKHVFFPWKKRGLVQKMKSILSFSPPLQFVLSLVLETFSLSPPPLQFVCLCVCPFPSRNIFVVGKSTKKGKRREKEGEKRKKWKKEWNSLTNKCLSHPGRRRIKNDSRTSEKLNCFDKIKLGCIFCQKIQSFLKISLTSHKCFTHRLKWKPHLY